MNTQIIDVTLASSQDRAPPQKTVESVLRRALKISDPRNVDELSRGLLLRYGKDALLMDRERKGLPFSVVTDVQAQVELSAGKRHDVSNAEADLERVLGEIARDPSLAEITAEMRGWARAIRAASADGLAAARFALDPHSSDRAMTARRTLGDYARVARYAASLASCGGSVFCRLAQACDAIASLILVLLGDGLAEAGVTRSTHIPRVPLSTLRQRRDTILTELQLLHRNASGGVSPDSWPRGTVSLVQIYDQLATSDAADLRALLDENYLSRQLDDLLDLASDASIDGLKALGSAAMLSVRRFRRFISVVTAEIQPPSPPLARFVAALTLFIQGFAVSAGGYRLPFIARSPLLAGQASLSGGADEPTIALIQIALARSAAAEWIDCLCCSCDEEDARNIILFTKMIYDLDRTIDLYAFGTEPDGQGEAEARAGAYGAVIEAIEVALAKGGGSSKFHDAVKKVIAMAPDLTKWRGFVKPPGRERIAGLMRETLCQQLKEERSSANLVSSISPICRRNVILEVRRGEGIAKVINDARTWIATAAGIDNTQCKDAEMLMPLDYETALTFRATSLSDLRVNLTNDD